MAVKPVTVKNLPYEVLIPRSRHHEAEAWCRARLGPRWAALDNLSGEWSCFWAGFQRGGGYRYHFESEKVAMEFALRWS